MNATDSLSRSKRLRQVIGFVLGLALLGLAVGYAVQGVDWSVVGRTPVWVVAALAGLVVLNLLITACLFWSVTRSFETKPKVGLGTMSALIAVSGVLNYIPVVRAGLWGRAAYLKKYHGLAVRDSVVILLLILALAVYVLGLAVLLILQSPEGWRLWFLLGGLILFIPINSLMWRQALKRPLVEAWMWVPLRSLDLAAAAGRLALAFEVVGVSLTWTDAVLLASANLIVKLVGLTPNGLGLSEWVVAGLSAAMMPIEAATAAAAALVDRAIEVGVMLVAGAIGAGWLKREVRRAGNVADEKAYAG